MKKLLFLLTCTILSLNYAYAQNITIKPTPEIVKEVQKLGANSSVITNFYNQQYIHQEFNFYDQPLSVLDAEVNNSIGSPYAKSEKENLENLLKGYIELKKQDSIINERLKKYGNCDNNLCEDRINSYNYLKNEIENYDIILFRDKWQKILKNIKNSTKLSDNDLVCLNGNFIKIKLPKSEYKAITIISGSSITNSIGICPRIVGGVFAVRASDNLTAVRIFDNTSNKVSRKIIKIINQSINKYPEVLVPENQKSKYAEEITGLDENYFKLVKERGEIKEKISFIEKNYFLDIPNLKNDNNYGKFSYIGNTTNRIPNGLGYLLNENKQLVCEAYWDEGFPIVLYKVNNYLNPGINVKWFRLFGDTYSNKYSKKYIILEPRLFKDSNLNIHMTYIGDYTYLSSDNSNYFNGFGNFFWSSWDKKDLQYYNGYYVMSKRTRGVHYSNQKKYDCVFSSDGSTPINGTYTSQNKFVYTGELKDWREHGNGKKVYENGKVEEGIFENGYLKMSLKEYQEELYRKEQERSRLEELRLAEEKKQAELKAAEEKKLQDAILQMLFEGSSQNNKGNNKNETCTCEWCLSKFNHRGFNILDEKNCKVSKNQSFGLFSIHCGNYCSPKCATEACWNK
jgi:hypothetical protein